MKVNSNAKILIFYRKCQALKCRPQALFQRPSRLPLLEEFSEKLGLFGAKLSDLGDYSLVAIHPKCNTIIFTARDDNILLSYHMDHEEVVFGRSSYPYLPYVPLGVVNFRVSRSTCF
jgi:hypothetical protein